LRALRNLGINSQEFDLYLEIFRSTIDLTLLLQALNILDLDNLHNQLKSLRRQVLANKETCIKKGTVATKTFYDEGLDSNKLAINLRNKIQANIFTLHKRRILTNSKGQLT
jgi:hypothetical protein